MALALVALLVTPASAFADVHVPAGRTVGEVTVIGQDVRVDGTLRASLTVIGGNAMLGPRAHAEDRVVVVAGRLDILPGARVDGDIVQLGSPVDVPDGLPAVALIVGLAAARLLLVALLLGAARLAAPWQHVRELGAEIAAFPLRTLAVGVLAGLGAGAAIVLLALTVIGLVAAAALCGALLAAGVLALAALLRALRPARRVGRVVGPALFVPGVGELLLALAVVAGLGGSLRLAGGRAGAGAAVTTP